MTTKQNYVFMKGKWLVNIRRGVQGFAFILFFFLLFHAAKVKNHEIPVLNYLFVILIILIIVYLAKLLKAYLQKSPIRKSLLIKISIFLLITVILGLILSSFHQFSKPLRLTYLQNDGDTIQQAIINYKTDKKKYTAFRDFTSLKTEISKKTEANIILKLPPLLLLVNYLFFFSVIALFLFVGGIYFLKKEPLLFTIVMAISILLFTSSQSSFFIIMLLMLLFIIKGCLYFWKKSLFKALCTISFLLLFTSLLSFSLLDYDFKPQFMKSQTAEGFYFFPTDFIHFDYFISIPQNIFLQTSPHIGVITSIALKTLVIGLGFILFFIIISVIFGRVFCSWICPFGTFHQIIAFLKMKIKQSYDKEVYNKKQHIKYVILTIVLCTALFSINFSGLFDPISIMTKSTTVFLIPSTQYTVNSSYDNIQASAEQEKEGGFFTLLTNLYRPLKEYLEEYVFYYNDSEEISEGYVPTHFQYYFLNGLIFLVLIALNLKRTRFWCHYICPAGALLGVFANRSFMRIEVNDNCIECGDCDQFCQGPADVSVKDAFKTSECMYCFNCINGCSSDALNVKYSIPFITPKNQLIPQKLNISKRSVISSIGIGFSSLLLLRSSFWEKKANPKLIRPPGSIEESDFLSRCVKCGECMKVCPKNFLHPGFLEAGLEGMFTPIGIARFGYCEYECNACGQVCPTQSIKKLTLLKKQEQKIGLALVRKDRCLTYAHQTPCIVCEEHCPTSPKAIWITEKQVSRRNGDKITLGQINVDTNQCIGCGICEYICPVVDQPGIFISSIQESRSTENQFLLEG